MGLRAVLALVLLLVCAVGVGAQVAPNLPILSAPSFGIARGGGTIACDIGPAYVGTIPAAATQAGFTHCAANYDFTQTASFSDSLGTHTWSTLSTWFNCDETSATGSWLMVMQAHYGGTSVPCDTSHQNIVNDGGTQALALTYLLTDKNAGNYNNVLTSGSFVGSSVTGTSYPTGYYWESVLRVSTTTPCSSSCIIYAPELTGLFVVRSQCYLETSLDEVSMDATTNTGLAPQNCSQGGTGPAPTPSPAPQVGSYTTYGILQTNNNANEVSVCNYAASGAVSGLPASAFESCNPLTMTNTEGYGTRQALVHWEGPESAGQGGSVWTATSHTTYTERTTMWVCPSPTGGSWQTTGECYNTPPITTAP